MIQRYSEFGLWYSRLQVTARLARITLVNTLLELRNSFYNRFGSLVCQINIIFLDQEGMCWDVPLLYTNGNPSSN